MSESLEAALRRWAARFPKPTVDAFTYQTGQYECALEVLDILRIHETDGLVADA